MFIVKTLLFQRILPDEYEYKLCEYLQLDREDKFLATLRMTLSTKEEALEWIRLFEEKSLTTHVKDKTFPKVERVSIFKVIMLVIASLSSFTGTVKLFYCQSYILISRHSIYLVCCVYRIHI